jgi:hypothetical protein
MPLCLGQSGFAEGSDVTVTQPVAPPAWKQVVLQARPVLRFLPPACRDPFFGQLAVELEAIGPGATPDDVYKLAAFCRIILQPLGRGGKRHCR